MKANYSPRPRPSTDERASRYLQSIPGAISGANGHAETFHAACVLVQGFDLSPERALPIFQQWNATCQPPWSDAELIHKLRDAEKAQSSMPRGYLLGDEPKHYAPPPARPLPPPGPRPLPTMPEGFKRGTPAQIQALADARPYPREAIDFASERRLLLFGRWQEFDCYAVTDKSRRVIELRRVDGKTFPAVEGTALGERKSHALKGSQKAWPVGIIESQEFPSIALVEGVPDFLQAHYTALWEQASDYTRRDIKTAPVAMLSASPAIHEDALPYFIGKHVRIFPHGDKAGLKGAAKWQKQLLQAGAATVDLFDFSAHGVNDLYEFETTTRNQNTKLFPVW